MQNVRGRRGKQISVFLDNKPGTLAAACEYLGENGVNIYALTMMGGIDHGYGRLVVDDHDKAVKLLHEKGYLVLERDVVLLEISNAPGCLGTVTRLWADAGINVEYAYCAGGPSVDQGMVVVKVDNTDQALVLLESV